jgi:hypothetical protein
MPGWQSAGLNLAKTSVFPLVIVGDALLAQLAGRVVQAQVVGDAPVVVVVEVEVGSEQRELIHLVVLFILVVGCLAGLVPGRER